MGANVLKKNVPFLHYALINQLASQEKRAAPNRARPFALAYMQNSAVNARFLSADLPTKLTTPNVSGRYGMNSKGPI